MQGDTAYRRRFPLHPLCKLRRGQPPSNPRLLSGACRPLTEYRNIYSDIPLIPLPAAGAASGRRSLLRLRPPQAPCRRVPPRPSTPRRLVDDAPGSARVAIAHGTSSARMPAKPSASCILAPSLRVARAAENLSLRESSSPPGSRFPPCAPSVRVRRAQRKAPDGARTYREGERSWKNFTQRQRR